MASASSSSDRDPSSLWRRLDLDVSGAPAARRRQLDRVAQLAHQAHGERAEDWFRSPQPALGGVLPLSLLRDPANGPRLVEQALLNALNGPLR